MGKIVFLSDKQENDIKAINKIAKKGSLITKASKVKQPKHIVINITNLVGVVNIYSEQDQEKLKEQIVKTLTSAVNGFTIKQAD